MSSATQTRGAYGIDGDWVSAGITGVVAGIVFGLMIQFVVGSMQAVGALFGSPGIVTGWIVHLAFSLAFVWPIWLNAVGFPPGRTLPVPFLQIRPAIGHLVYGAILGGGYPLLR